jgi:hypothetical protein
VRRSIAASLIAMVATALLARAPHAAGQEEPASASVFMLQVIEKTPDGHYRGVSHGSAFFISDDGRALTNSHVVYPLQADPSTRSLLAIVGKEFYGATLTCASRLFYDPTKPAPHGGVPLGRDVAEIRVTAPAVPFHRWGRDIQGTFYELAHAHEGPLPQFHALPLGNGVGRGDHVHVIGYGHISPIPYPWEASGMVDQEWRASDGTEVFSVKFTSRPQPGNSGSPVLNDRGEAVGLWTWDSMVSPDTGVAQKISSVVPACR